MFALFKKTSCIAPVPIPIPDASPFEIISRTEVVDEEYRNLAAKVGVLHLLGVPDQQRQLECFESFLVSLGIRRYNQQEVKQYLNEQYGKIPWGFRALRERDNPGFALGHFLASDGRCNNGDRPTRDDNGIFIGGRDRQVYLKPVPYPVLLTIDRINERFPTATFWISDEMMKQPVPKDPFLLVLFEEHSYIIERWDEPAFRAMTASAGPPA